MTKLDEIIAFKRSELERKKQTRSLAKIEREAKAAKPPLDFLAALRKSSSRPALIAECKRASPSRGILAENLDPVDLARIYAESGAAAVSVLTDERFFRGTLDDLRRVSGAELNIPVLRKDFILDESQVYEARAAGADAVLLIVAALEKKRLYSLNELVRQMGMATLVEVHDWKEIQTALECKPQIVGINNRNLHNFTVRMETSIELRRTIPADICVVAESGIRTVEDVRRLAEAGMDAILVGEALVTSEDIPEKVRSLAWIEQRIST
jgi:indole-3-glycerol phosphate synthase